MDDTKQELLDSFDWNRAIIVLAAYAISLDGFSRKRLPKGLEPEDLVMQAVEKVFSGKRKWDPAKDPDLMKYLKSVVKSIYSNETTSKEGDTAYIEELEGFDPAVQSNAEEEIHSRELDRSILTAIRSDPDLLLVYRGLKDGFTPAEIEQEFGMPVRDIRNAQKKLHRRVLSLIRAQIKEQGL